MTEPLTVEELKHFLRFEICPISTDYLGYIAEEIFEDVKEDLECAADKDFNYDDVRMSVGRVLISRLGIEY